MSNPQDTHTPIPDQLLVYESGNGDAWFLCADPATGLPAVKHVANPQSGGHISLSDVDNFLSGQDGPEHQALRRLLKQDDLSTILIAYDVHQGQQSAYRDLAEAIQSLGAWWHHLETVWILKSDKTPEEIRDRLSAHINADDQLLVVDITRSEMEWAGVNDAGSSWLKGHIDRDILAA